jgi:NAD-dependent SIR2 family protein deacetylase
MFKKIWSFFFKPKCNHCGSKNLQRAIEKEQNYGSQVFTEIFKCNDCGAESRKSTVLRKKDVVPDKFKTLTKNNQ